MTTNDIAVRPTETLAIRDDQTAWTSQQVSALSHLGVENAPNGDLELFFHQCQRTGLDPFARQIYMIGRWSPQGTKYTIQTGIDGFRLVGRRAADAAHHSIEISDTEWCDPDGKWHDVWMWKRPPVAARVAVIRDGGRFPAIALYDEYVQTKKDGDPTKMWADRGAGQLAKCAEALAWRKAFPQDLSGLYTADEMGQATNDAPAQPQTRPQSIQDAIQGSNSPVSPIPAPVADGISDAQSRKMGALMRENGLSARDDALQYVAGVIGRDVSSRNELSKAEASAVIEALTLSNAPDTVNHETGEVLEAELIPQDDPWANQGGAA